MISQLSNESNFKLLKLLENTLNMNALDITKMKDNDVLAIFLKLTFQHRYNTGIFTQYGSYASERNDIDYISNELANMELLK